MLWSQLVRLATVTSLAIFAVVIPTNAWAFCEFTWTFSGPADDGVWADHYVTFDAARDLGGEGDLSLWRPCLSAFRVV
jgi:hypothetical protein